MFRILLVLSGASKLPLADRSTRPTGFWPEELADPVRIFTESGAEITLATPGGAPAVPDPAGLTPEGTGLSSEDCDQLCQSIARLRERLDAPASLDDLTAEPFDAAFIPGGYAPMADLWSAPSCGGLLAAFQRSGKPVAAVCHGPVALLSCVSATGGWPFAGYRMTAFSDDEEQDVGLLDNLPWTGEQALAKHGAQFSSRMPWSPYVVVDRNLLTGQNPASAAPLARRLLEFLRQHPE